jgi:hypothetical protein
MRNYRNILLTACLLTVGLVSCQDDDVDAEIIQPLAGGYIGTEDCGSIASTHGQYQTVVYNTANGGPTEVFIENIGDVNALFFENPHEKFEVTLEDGKFTLAPTTHTFSVYETAAASTAAATASTNAGRQLDLRTTFTYTVAATGTITGKILTMSYQLTDSRTTRRRFTNGNVVNQPVVTGELDGACTFTGDKDFRFE